MILIALKIMTKRTVFTLAIAPGLSSLPFAYPKTNESPKQLLVYLFLLM